MHLRIEEDLRVLDPIRVRPCEIGDHEVFEIILRLERPHQRIVEVEERLQVFELVLRAQFVDARPRQYDTVSFGERECQIRFECPFDMQMQFAFRHRRERLFHCLIHHGSSFPDSIGYGSLILPVPGSASMAPKAHPRFVNVVRNLSLSNVTRGRHQSRACAKASG